MSQQDFLFAPSDEHIEVESPISEGEKFLMFTSGGILFGASSDYVVEIITSHVITPIPLLPPHVQGVINLRGQILPILDIRTMLNHDVSDNSCIIILNISGTMLGILVDGVDKMLSVTPDTILPAPAKHDNSLVSGMCFLPEQKTMLIFDCQQLI